MDCARCGKEIETDAGFCRHCGAKSRTTSAPRRLFRLPARGKLAGVCAGLADYLDTDVTLVRLVWVILSVPGMLIGGLIAYLAAWIVIPESTSTQNLDERTRLTRSTEDRKIAGVCGGLAEFLGIDSTVVRFAWVVLAIIPGAIIFGCLAYLVAWFIMPERPASAMVAAPHTA